MDTETPVWQEVLARLEGCPNGDDWQLKSTALRELSRLGVPGDAATEDHAVKVLRHLSTHSRWQVRQGVAEILPSLPFGKVKDIIEHLRSDPTRWVNERAEWARKKLRVSATIDKRDRKYDYAVGLVRNLKRKYPDITDEMMADVLKLSFKTGERYFEEVASQAMHQVKTILLSLSEAIDSVEAGLRGNGRPSAKATRASLRAIRDEKENLASLFENLMQYARPGDGQFTKEDAESILVDAAARAKKIARGINLKAIRWKISNARSLHLECDRDRLVEALANLIANGIEAMPRGGNLALATQPGPSGSVRFIISDAGPGMSPEDLEMNKRPGATGKRRTGQRYWHSGLGLTYAAKVVDLSHEGQIRLDTGAKRGTTLVVELPALREENHGST